MSAKLESPCENYTVGNLPNPNVTLTENSQYGLAPSSAGHSFHFPHLLTITNLIINNCLTK
jgi:hypothetical protein